MLFGTLGKDAIIDEEEEDDDDDIDDDDDGSSPSLPDVFSRERLGTSTSSSPPRVRTRTCITTGPGQNFDASRRNASRLSLKLAALSLRFVFGVTTGVDAGASGSRSGRGGVVGPSSAPLALVMVARGEGGKGASFGRGRAGGGGLMTKVLGLVKWQKLRA
jgi:hypothetical protein